MSKSPKMSSESFKLAFQSLRDFKALKNHKRLQQVIQNTQIIITGDEFQDSSLFVYIPSSKSIDSFSEMDFQLAIETLMFLAQLISGKSVENLTFSIFLDCSKDSMKDVSKKIEVLSKYFDNITMVYILEPDRSFGNIFSGDPRQLLQTYQWMRSKLMIGNSLYFSKQTFLPNTVPKKYGGSLTFDSIIWTKALKIYIDYLSRILELFLLVDQHMQNFDNIAEFEDPNNLIRFLKTDSVHRISQEISYKINEMLNNRESVLAFFSKPEFLKESPKFFPLVASRIIGMCEKLNNAYKEVCQNTQNRLNSLNDMKNLDEYLNVHCEIIAEKTRIVFNHKYSISNLEFWLRKIEENIICEREIISKLKNELEIRQSRSKIDSDVFIGRCNKIRELMSTYTNTIDKQVDSLKKQLIDIEETALICIDQVKSLNDCMKIENIGDFFALYDQDPVYLLAVVEECYNLPTKITKRVRTVLHKIQITKNSQNLIKLFELFRNSNKNIKVNETNILPEPRHQNSNHEIQLQYSDDKNDEDDYYNSESMPDKDDDSNYESYQSPLDEIAEEARKKLDDERKYRKRAMNNDYMTDSDENTDIKMATNEEELDDVPKNARKSQYASRRSRKNKKKDKTKKADNYRQQRDDDYQAKQIAKGLSKDGGTFVQQQIQVDSSGVKLVNKKITRKGSIMITETERVTLKGKRTKNENHYQEKVPNGADRSGLSSLFAFFGGISRRHTNNNQTNASIRPKRPTLQLDSPNKPIVHEND